VNRRIAGLLPILVGTLSLAVAAGALTLAATIAALSTVLAIAGPRWELDRGRQIVTSAMGAGAGYAAAVALFEPEPAALGEGWTRLAAGLLIAAAARFLIIAPRGGYSTTMALTFSALVATGETRGKSYAVFVALFLLTNLLALRANDDGFSGLQRHVPRIAIGTAILLVAAAFGAGTTSGLRHAHAWFKARGHSTAFDWRPRVGFSDSIDLGALDGLLDSDTVVLRVRGPRVDYLRGAALDVYSTGRWLRSDEGEREIKATYSGEIATDDVVEVAAVSEREGRFFLPLEAASLIARPPEVFVDDLGSVKRAAKHGIPVARFVRGPRDRADPAALRDSDLQLPRRLRPSLERLAVAWAGSAATATEKLDAIEHRLKTEFRYARTFHRGQELDPALDFLFQNKSGHCEYFATALALVARAAGVPTRVVMGYRVGEHSPFGYYVVRDRNAHAWVEAWVPAAGWTTRDATPIEGLPQNGVHEASYAASALDALRVGYDELTDWLGRLTVRQTAIAALAGFIVVVFIVGRGARRRARPRPMLDDEAPLPYLDLLLVRIARGGHLHGPDEPIERLAARITDPRARELLGRYAALRYGDIGDHLALANDVRAYAMIKFATK
jgi:transglutaminase-like putative cysteine protease